MAVILFYLTFQCLWKRLLTLQSVFIRARFILFPEQSEQMWLTVFRVESIESFYPPPDASKERRPLFSDKVAIRGISGISLSSTASSRICYTERFCHLPYDGRLGCLGLHGHLVVEHNVFKGSFDPARRVFFAQPCILQSPSWPKAASSETFIILLASWEIFEQAYHFHIHCPGRPPANLLHQTRLPLIIFYSPSHSYPKPHTITFFACSVKHFIIDSCSEGKAGAFWEFRPFVWRL